MTRAVAEQRGKVTHEGGEQEYLLDMMLESAHHLRKKMYVVHALNDLVNSSHTIYITTVWWSVCVCYVGVACSNCCFNDMNESHNLFYLTTNTLPNNQFHHRII
jgi:hypothetical protein